jgi:imidazoleglycerol-phosphate dehydratase
MRTSRTERKTQETEVILSLNLDGEGTHRVQTGIGFFDHLLTSLARHASFDLEVTARGDNEHHVVEDTALTLGEALRKALGKKEGIQRFGHAIVPMDDVLLLVSIDLGGRPYVSLSVPFRKKKIEDLSAEMIPHFLESFASEARINLHGRVLDGKNEHHKAEALFKALALSLKEACRITGKGVPSTKGTL